MERFAAKPREIVMQVLVRNPTHPKALEMAGTAAYEVRDYAGAANFWRELEAQLAPGSQEQRELAAAIARADLMAAAEPTFAQAAR